MLVLHSGNKVMDLEQSEFREVHLSRSGIFIGIKGVLYHHKSRFQEITVYETHDFGKMLTLDGMVMVTERDEYLYHEMLVHPAMILTPEIENILVIGGGDGGTAREVIRYQDVKSVKVVELDRDVVRVAREFFPALSKSFEDPKVEAIYMDGIDFLRTTGEKFDVIIVDSPDPIGHAEILFTENFYTLVRKRLKSHGSLVAQTESPFYHLELIKRVNKTLRKLFSWVKVYLGPVITYPSGTWSYTIARGEPGIRPFRQLPEGLKWFKEEMLEGLFVLPGILRNVEN